jgi:hypothetical protein
MAVIGWFSAIGCIQPGIESTGTYALDTHVSGNTSGECPGRPGRCPVEEAVLDVLGHAGGGAGPREQHGHHEAGHQEVDVGNRTGADGAPANT